MWYFHHRGECFFLPDILCKYSNFTVALLIKSLFYGKRKSTDRSLKARNWCCCGGKQHNAPGENTIAAQYISKAKKQAEGYQKLFCKPFGDLSRASNLTVYVSSLNHWHWCLSWAKLSASQCIRFYSALMSVIQKQLFYLILGRQIEWILPVIKKVILLFVYYTVRNAVPAIVQFVKTLQCFVRFPSSVLLIVAGAHIIDDFKDKLSNTWKALLFPW